MKIQRKMMKQWNLTKAKQKRTKCRTISQLIHEGSKALWELGIEN
tara:strand:- start:149 stop:283 length:135 start_codon:yes stop_codon:yes gene_type:complete